MRMFVAGWFGAGNLGDEAILLSQLHQFRKHMGDAEFHILSFDPRRTRQVTASIPEVKKIVRMGSKRAFLKSQFVSLLSSIKNADVVVIGGGGLFQDLYNHYPIPFFTFISWCTRLFRRPLIMYSLGIGPLRTALGRALTRRAVEWSRIVSVRDDESRTLLQQIGVTKKVHVTSDPVFMLPSQDEGEAGKIRRRWGLRPDRPAVGVCVQDLLPWGEQNRKGFAHLLDDVATAHNADIIFLPFGTYTDGWRKSKRNDPVDVRTTKHLMAMMSAKAILVTEELMPGEMLSLMQRLDLVVSMRLHGLILAVTAGTPVIAVTYSEESKLRNLMNRLGQLENLFDVRELSSAAFLERVRTLIQSQSMARDSLAAFVRKVQGETRDFDEEFFQHMKTLAEGDSG